MESCMTDTTDEKIYILELKNGQMRRIRVPASYKVTFGPLIPGERHGSGCLALRFYEGKDHQRAIFTDVKSFRDASIPIEEKRVKTDSKRVRKNTAEGAKDFIVEARTSEWVDPDEDHAPASEFKQLPGFLEEEDLT
jgi:hypothetical protein